MTQDTSGETQARRIVSVVAAAWFGCAPSFAQDQRAVPIDQEPRHKLVLENEQIRIFDTRIPAGDVTLFHTHLADSVFVCIDGAETQSEEPGKPPPKRPPFQPGDVWYRAHLQAPLTHRVHNVGASDSRVLDIELVGAPKGASEPLPPLPRNFKPILENDRLRVSRLVLGPQQAIADSPKPRPGGLTVIVKGGRAIVDTPPDHTLIEFDPGDYTWRARPTSQNIRNGGTTTIEAIEIELK